MNPCEAWGCGGNGRNRQGWTDKNGYPEDQYGDCGFPCRDTEVTSSGMCTGCGSVEVSLNKATGTHDLSSMGESATYPTGYGCEVCS